MTLSDADLSHFLLSLSLLLAAALAVGALFSRYGQPRVIGEIVGGLLLGPSLLGAVAPSLQESLFPSRGGSSAAAAAVGQLGLIWLLFSVGTELRRLPAGNERVTALSVLACGTVLPFAVGLGLLSFVSTDRMIGVGGDATAFALVFAATLSITSIPVISRIMFDLRLLGTGFARIVLGAAVCEDIVLFAILGIAVGISQGSGGDFGMAAVLGITPASAIGAGYYFGAVSACLAVGVILSRSGGNRTYLLRQVTGSMGLELLFVLLFVCGCLLISVPPLFGGLAAGLALGGGGESEATDRIKSYGLAFFVPVYFAMVGLRLDLLHAFDPVFFAAFFLFACVVKALSVYVGARLAGESSRGSWNFAVAMNARGGPGIVLATVALDAGIINANFYSSMVLLAILSSLLAGWWLRRALVSRGLQPRVPGQIEVESVPASVKVRPAADLGGS